MESLLFELSETARLIRREFDRRAAAHGVTRAQWRVLVRLVRQDGSRQVDLADALDVEPITLCRMVDRLSEGGFVERRRDEIDRRAWNIHLTAKAGPVIEDLQALGDEFEADALDGIKPADRDLLRGLLNRLRSNLGAANAQTAGAA